MCSTLSQKRNDKPTDDVPRHLDGSVKKTYAEKGSGYHHTKTVPGEKDNLLDTTGKKECGYGETDGDQLIKNADKKNDDFTRPDPSQFDGDDKAPVGYETICDSTVLVPTLKEKAVQAKTIIKDREGTFTPSTTRQKVRNLSFTMIHRNYFFFIGDCIYQKRFQTSTWEKGKICWGDKIIKRISCVQE